MSVTGLGQAIKGNFDSGPSKVQVMGVGDGQTIPGYTRENAAKEAKFIENAHSGEAVDLDDNMLKMIFDVEGDNMLKMMKLLVLNFQSQNYDRQCAKRKHHFLKTSPGGRWYGKIEDLKS